MRPVTEKQRAVLRRLNEVRATATHCQRGHLIPPKRGKERQRRCAQCANERSKAWRKKHAAYNGKLRRFGKHAAEILKAHMQGTSNRRPEDMVLDLAKKALTEGLI